jgi:CDP-diglyceride synthetase
MLEIFGQLFLSVITSLGYLFFFLQPKLVYVTLCLSWQADNGGLFIGNLLGKRPFAQSISPKKTVEGIIGAWVLCFLSAIFMWYVSK